MSDTATTIVKVQVPMSKDLRDRLAARAAYLGFDSVQAFFRFMAKAEVDERKVDFDVDDWGEPTPEAAARLNAIADQALQDHKAGKLKAYHTVDEALAHLHSL